MARSAVGWWGKIPSYSNKHSSVLGDMCKPILSSAKRLLRDHSRVLLAPYRECRCVFFFLGLMCVWSVPVTVCMTVVLELCCWIHLLLVSLSWQGEQTFQNIPIWNSHWRCQYLQMVVVVLLSRQPEDKCVISGLISQQGQSTETIPVLSVHEFAWDWGVTLRLIELYWDWKEFLHTWHITDIS